MYLGNLVGLVVVLTCVPLFAAILRVPFTIIGPVILVFCAIGAYTVHNSTFDVVMMLVFGAAGYLLKKCDYPLAPMVWRSCWATRPKRRFGSRSWLARESGVFFANGLRRLIMVLGLIALFWPIYLEPPGPRCVSQRKPIVRTGLISCIIKGAFMELCIPETIGWEAAMSDATFPQGHRRARIVLVPSEDTSTFGGSRGDGAEGLIVARTL